MTIRKHTESEPLGHGSDMSLFVGGLDLAARSAKMKTPYSKGTDIGIEEPPHPFYLQKASIHIDGQTEMFQHDRGLGQRTHRQRTKTYPAPPPSKRIRPRRTTPKKVQTKIHSYTPRRLPKPYPSQRLSAPWKPIRRKISTIPSVKVLGGHTHGMGLRPQGVLETVRKNVLLFRNNMRNAIFRAKRR